MGSSVIPWAESRFARWVALLLIVHLTCGLGCAAPSGEALDVDTLEAQFEQRARAVLRGDEALVPTAGGFELAPRPSRAGAALAFSSDGSSAVRFDLPDGLGIEVRERGLHGEVQRVGAAIAYPRAGGFALWTAQRHGAEEWLWFPEGAPAGAPLASWQVEGARLRRRGANVEILDAAGEPRILVAAPEAYASPLRRIPTRLEVQGDEISLWVEEAGSPLLVDPSWSVTAASDATLRAQHTATLLPDGRVLIAGGVSAADRRSHLASAAIYDPALDAWLPAAPMSKQRSVHTATLLADGRVLVTGGASGGAEWVSSAELYDPATDAWTPAATMISARSSHTATLLADGRVLAAGGAPPGGAPGATAELYDPVSDTWSPTPAASVARSGHAAARLRDGRVLIVGGRNIETGVLSSVEIYDPTTGAWTPGPDMLRARWMHTASLLEDGDVLVIGYDREGEAETYDPEANAWTLASNKMSSPRVSNTATRLCDGRVLVSDNVPPDLYDPSTRTFSRAPRSEVSRSDATATLLPDGRVLFVGGHSSTVGADIYDPSVAPSGTQLGPLHNLRYFVRVVELADGKVLIAGTGVATTEVAELFDPSSRTFSVAAPSNLERYRPELTRLADGRVLLSGGLLDYFAADLYNEIYDPAADAWTLAAPDEERRYNHTATLLGSGEVLIAGGEVWDYPMEPYLVRRTGSAALYRPADDTWVAVEPMNARRAEHAATLLDDGRVLVVGGIQGDDDYNTEYSTAEPLASAEIYDPATRRWSLVAPMAEPRDRPTATRLPDGRVLVVGGAAEVYDPMTNAWTATGPMSPMLAFNHVAMLMPTGEVLVIGGATAQIYSPATNSWTPAPSPLLSYGSLASVLLPSGDVLLVGWSSYPELYDPRWHSPGDNGCSTGAGGEGGAGGGESGAGGAGGGEPGTGGVGGAGGEESVTGGAGSGGSGTGSVGGAGGVESGTGGMGGAGGDGAGAGGRGGEGASGTATASSGAGGSGMETAAGAGGDGSLGPTSTSSGPGAGDPPAETGCSMAQGASGGGASGFYLAVAATALRRRLRRSRAAIPR
ncbi:Kelch repeat-containing protein [Sorangium atrum]|uniref:Kelch repeat-containing protein n=1 Tax=Sorangium atrum TaxID=2995308 RepID=A0ABT5C665_9BACT|nr:kelch repeat-containing protein [Sorangium aterium]MDC0681453.1 kelch repeat-containing protein [Sorangium aterium]